MVKIADLKENLAMTKLIIGTPAKRGKGIDRKFTGGKGLSRLDKDYISTNIWTGERAA